MLYHANLHISLQNRMSAMLVQAACKCPRGSRKLPEPGHTLRSRRRLSCNVCDVAGLTGQVRFRERARDISQKKLNPIAKVRSEQ